MGKLRIYKTYHFQRDPRIDELLEMAKHQGVDHGAWASETDIGRSTIRNLAQKKTRRPLISTLSALGGTMGMDLVWADAKEMALFKKRLIKRSLEIQAKRASKKNAKGKKKATG